MDKLIILIITVMSACFSKSPAESDKLNDSASAVSNQQRSVDANNTSALEVPASDENYSKSASSKEVLQGQNPENPIGVLISAGAGNNRSPKVRLQAFKELGITYVRHGITMSQWDGQNAFYESLKNAGFKILLNVGYLPQGGDPQPFPTDMEKYKSTLNDILTEYTPEILVVENEEYNKSYHTGSMEQYLIELQAAIDVAHSKNIKVTNGGLVSRILTLTVWKDYYDRGMKKEAADFAKRVVPTDIVGDLPNLARHKALIEGMKAFDTLLNAYKTMDLDYVNFHWYEPIQQRTFRNKEQKELIENVDTKGLEEVVQFLRRRTGKEVLTNEIGQLNTSPTVVKDVLKKCLELRIPYIIWYSGDGGEGKSVALTNFDGSLRENGKKFSELMKYYRQYKRLD